MSLAFLLARLQQLVHLPGQFFAGLPLLIELLLQRLLEAALGIEVTTELARLLHRCRRSLLPGRLPSGHLGGELANLRELLRSAKREVCAVLDVFRLKRGCSSLSTDCYQVPPSRLEVAHTSVFALFDWQRHENLISFAEQVLFHRKNDARTRLARNDPYFALHSSLRDIGPDWQETPFPRDLLIPRLSIGVLPSRYSPLSLLICCTVTTAFNAWYQATQSCPMSSLSPGHSGRLGSRSRP